MQHLFSSCSVRQDRMQFWHDQTHRYHTELLDFKKLAAETIDGLQNEHSALTKDLGGAATRVDRVEREMEYVETQTSPRACANKADKVLEQGSWGLEESRAEEEEEEEWVELYSRVSGELQGKRPVKDGCVWRMAAFDLDFSLMTELWLHQLLWDVQSLLCLHTVKFSIPSRRKRHFFCSLGKSTVLENGKQTQCCYKSFQSSRHVFQNKCASVQLIYLSRATLPLFVLSERGICLYNLPVSRRALQTMLRWRGCSESYTLVISSLLPRDVESFEISFFQSRKKHHWMCTFS